MRRALAVTVFAAALVVAAIALWPHASGRAVSVCGPVDSTPAEIGIGPAGEATLCLLNQQRTLHGLHPLAPNSLLTQAAVAHSEDMVTRAYFEHTAPDGRTVQDRIRATGYARNASASSGENIAWGIGPKATPRAIVAKWMASPPHRADILRPAFTDIGIGVAVGVPKVSNQRAGLGATYTTDFGGAFDPSLPSG